VFVGTFFIATSLVFPKMGYLAYWARFFYRYSFANFHGLGILVDYIGHFRGIRHFTPFCLVSIFEFDLLGMVRHNGG
jgi:hypothetical protein